MSVTKTGESERGCREPVKLIKQNPSMDSPQRSGHIWRHAPVSEFKFSLFTLSPQVKERVKVEVGVEAVGGWGAVEGLEGGVLSLVEGEEREVVCEGRQGYPAPSFLWDSHKPDLISEGRRRRGKGLSEEGERRDGSEVKEVAERSVELELFNGEEEEAIPLNTTSKVRIQKRRQLLLACNFPQPFSGC